MVSPTDEILRPFGLVAADLSPQDAAASAAFDFEKFEIASVSSVGEPAFDIGYAALWAEFGEKNELEERAVLARRLAWHVRPPAGDYAMRYEMIVIRRGGQFVAVCDQTAIVPRQGDGDAIVHFSHLLIAPPFRGSGLGGWLRAWPVATARNAMADAKLPGRAIMIVGECEPADGGDAANVRRLRAFERAGFLKVDPLVVNYLQPDFRPAAVIDATGGPRPVPLSLVLRRVGRSPDQSIAGRELRSIVHALYAMYGDGFRAADMRPVVESLAAFPQPDASVALVPPTLLSPPPAEELNA